MIFFDLEFYVPKLQRNTPNSKGTLVFNPTFSEHIILGGHFVISNLNDQKKIASHSLWLWNYPNEKQMISAIIQIFKQEFERQQGILDSVLEKRIKDIVTCGFAIGRIDLPSLFIKSQSYQLDSPASLFNLFLKTKIIDLSNVASFLFKDELTFYPKTANEVAKKIFPKNPWKPSGKKVWDYYDLGEYDMIENRCKSEVDDIIKIYNELQNKIEEKK